MTKAWVSREWCLGVLSCFLGCFDAYGLVFLNLKVGGKASCPFRTWINAWLWLVPKKKRAWIE